jgi:putative FmdB family regulatory protein
MFYDYTCSNCKEVWDESSTIAKRDLPSTLPCPKCGAVGCVSRLVSAPAVSYNGSKGVRAKAGSEWNGVLKQIKKNSGRRSTIETM